MKTTIETLEFPCEIKKKLKISLGIFLTKSHIEGLTPPISRGQVFDNNGKEVAVLQNEMGNF